jgi:hypothetical protein
MEISESELRAMVREAIARQAGRPAAGEGHQPAALLTPADSRIHPSHGRLPLTSGDADGFCVIEPAVRCNHCGYCLSVGH